MSMVLEEKTEGSLHADDVHRLPQPIQNQNPMFQTSKHLESMVLIEPPHLSILSMFQIGNNLLTASYAGMTIPASVRDDVSGETVT